ncbi:hypothetical protein ACQJBY_059792 [Aegilops geniculata]
MPFLLKWSFPMPGSRPTRVKVALWMPLCIFGNHWSQQEFVASQLQILSRLYMQSAATKCLEHLVGAMEVEFDCPQLKKMKVEMTRLSRNIDDRDSKISA